MDLGKVDYASGKVPSGYRCRKCRASGCKLWREYQTNSPRLLCAGCAMVDQGKTGVVDASGNFNDGIGLGSTDQIGWYVPAVPDEEGIGYWGYSAVPQAGCDWWHSLPTRPIELAPT